MEPPIDLPVQDTADVQALGRVGIHRKFGRGECRTVLFVGAVVAVVHVVAHLGRVGEALAVGFVRRARKLIFIARCGAT